MLRADAPAFTPQHVSDMSKVDFGFNFMDDGVSTAAPSPNLTSALSPLGSPDLSMQSWCDMFFANSDLLSLETDSLILPDAEHDIETEFKLQGLDELEGSVAGLLMQLEGSAHAQKIVEPSAVVEPPPGLDSPPGLDLPTASNNVDAPPGLDLPQEVSSKKWSCSVTTAMLRNIPNKYTQAMLVQKLHEKYKGDLDFIYLPVDFKNKCNVGYAFLNFRTSEAFARFADEFHEADSRVKLPGFNSKKVCQVSAARVQGRDANVRRLRSSPVMAQLVEKPEWLPQLYGEDGESVPFPLPEESKQRSSRHD